MPSPSQRELFVDLLRELRSAGPIGRLRLLGRGVDALRQLSPWDRKVLLRMAGFEGAESLIERLAVEDGETAERLQRVLAEIERDPKRAEATVRALTDPDQRGEAIESLVDLLDRANDEDAPPPAPPAPPKPPPAPSAPGRPVPAAKPSSPESARVAAAATVAAAAAAKAEAEIENRAKPVEPETAPPPAPERPLPPEPEPPKPPKPPEPPEPPEPKAPVRSTAPELSDLSSGLVERSARGVLHALLDLRERLEAGESVPGEALRAMLSDETLPPWARRRAVTAWIEARRPDVDGALGVIGELGSAGDRTWCLGALAASRQWPPAAWEKILAAAPHGPARRRLARRRPAA